VVATSARLIGFSLGAMERIVMAMVGGVWCEELTVKIRRRQIKINELIRSTPTDACPLACLPIMGVPWHPRGLWLSYVVLLTSW
jgi:hypothetical protein